jgi:hypothetical protein
MNERPNRNSQEAGAVWKEKNRRERRALEGVAVTTTPRDEKLRGADCESIAFVSLDSLDLNSEK